MTRFCAIALAMSPMLALLGCGGGGGPSLEVKVGDEVAFSCGEMKVTELGPDEGGFRYDGCGHAVWVEFDTNSGHAGKIETVTIDDLSYFTGTYPDGFAPGDHGVHVIPSQTKTLTLTLGPKRP
ncbi:MAG: hypothetical protein KC635_27015 [Myxococcales bacterium]|nr:hypothetical protein [Myxococcales bacterium]MCB9732516.1 hypothetical protein [Deltaproteobacteria bacterium]